MNESTNKKCSAYATKCVCIEIKGTPHSKGFPYLPDDGDLVSEFLQWSLDNKIYTLISGGHSGGGSYKGFYSEEDADKICEWLKDKVNNAT